MYAAHLAAAYLLGGITFLPLLLVLIFVYSAVALPHRQGYAEQISKSTTKDALNFDDENAELKIKLQTAERESDVAAGYFAVCREYVAAGINGKPPERKTPAGETIAAESPSVYQSMYRSIFDRNKTQQPTIEAGKPVKRTRNVFYVVLRHGHLVLFDNSDQLEVRHVISLAHYNVDIYAGGEDIPEGELYIKRNCIRLHRTSMPENATTTLAPFYLFSDNCSEKEDFYHALLQSQRKLSDSQTDLPVPQEFETEDMIKLVRLLHLSEDTNHTRWINALLGRVFLALYKTPEIENWVRDRITKKISRVSKPNFITSLVLKDVTMGESAPIFNSLKLKEIMIDGSVTLEADVKYTGKFRSVFAAIAKIELGQRFKPREVNLILAAELRRLDGHLLIHVKPPPSNRIWVSFETMPKLEMAIEPIVSSRQITYGIIIRAIESRIREVVAETLVIPNWDDTAFINTETQRYRGGIWQSSVSTVPDPSEPSVIKTDIKDQEEAAKPAADMSSESPPTREKQAESAAPSPRIQTPRRASTIGIVGSDSEPETVESPSKSPTETLFRSSSFAAPLPASASPAIVTKIPVMKVKRGYNGVQKDAATTMKRLSSRSQDSSPAATPYRRPSTPPSVAPSIKQMSASSSLASTSADDEHSLDALDGRVTESSPAEDSSNLKAINEPQADTSGGASSVQTTEKIWDGTLPEKRATLNESLASATVAAKRWGLGMMQRQKESFVNASTRPKAASGIPTAQPIGRGQPLPPPGEPLPGPADSRSWTSNAFGSLTKKPVSPSLGGSTPPNHQKSSSISSINSLSSLSGPPAMLDDQPRNPEPMVYAEPNHVDSSTPTPSVQAVNKEEEEVKGVEEKIKTS